MTITTNNFRYTPQLQSDMTRGMEGIAEMFRQPTPDERATYASARQRNAAAQLDEDQAARLRALDEAARLKAGVSKDDWDRMAVAAGRGTIANGYYGVDQGNATELAKNANTVRGDAIVKLFGNQDPGQSRPAVPANVASTIGLPSMPAVAGAPKPLSETEWTAQQNDRLLMSGKINDQVLIDAIVGKNNPVEAVGAAGKPVYMSPGAAVRTGAEVAAKPPSTVINNGGESAYDKTLGEANAKSYVQIQDDAAKALGTLNTIGAMRDLMAAPNFYSGPAAQQIQAAKQIGAALGIAVPDAASPMEAFTALTNQLVVDAAGGSLGNQISNGDVAFLTNTKPNLNNTPEGNKLLLDITEKLAHRKQDVAKWADEYAAAHGGRLDAGFNAFSKQKAEAAPLFAQTGSVAHPQTAAEYSALPSGSLFVDPDDGQTYRKP